MAKRRLAVEIVGDADKLDKAYKQSVDGADRFEKHTTSAFDKAGKSSDTFGQKMSGLRDKADGWGQGLALGIGAAAGALAAGVFVKGFSDAMDKEAGQAMLGIQLGLPPEMAKAAGELAGEVYTSGFGESLEDTNQAVRYITQNMGGLGDVTKDEMKDMTKGVLTLAAAFDEDLNKVTAAAGTLIKTGLAKDGKEALDILTRGLASPANKAEDLLDTFIEYSTQFRQLGITGPQALGLLSQGLAGGARDADTVADTLKGFVERVGEISTNPEIAGAFARIGLNADDMAARIAAGGPAAQEAFGMALAALAPYSGSSDYAALSTMIFGDKAVDMQGALNSLDLTAATTAIGSVEGAMTDATAATDTNKAKVEEWQRSMQTNFSDFIAVSVIPWFDTMGQKLADMGHQWDTNTGLVGRFHDGLSDIGDAMIELKDKAIDPIVGSLQTLFGWLGDCIEKLENFGSWIGGGIGGAMDAIRNGTLLGFNDGGVIPGPKGKSKLVMAHAGETVLPTHRMSMSSALEKWVTYEDGSTGLQRLDSGGNWYGVTPAMDRAAYDLKAGMDFAALGWPEEDVRAIADLLAGGSGGTTSGMGGGTVINVNGPVYGEADFIQKIRSGNYQAERTGRGF